jgi:formiminoglutamase
MEDPKKPRGIPMADDPKWPRASTLISHEISDIAIIDIPAFKTAISKTGADKTPGAIREALKGYSTFSYTTSSDLGSLSIQDLGVIENPDDNEEKTITKLSGLNKQLVIALGGDNSITYAATLGLLEKDLANARLITLDAHHDLRDGVSNGSPIRRLIDAGFNPSNIFQIGINDFSNSPEYAIYAKSIGVNVVSRSTVAEIGIAKACEIALTDAKGPIFVDIDVDVCDRSFVPGCPAAAPGGISAFELRQAARILASHKSVKGIDITEIDAKSDSADQRTIRLGALLVLEIATGFLQRAL